VIEKRAMRDALLERIWSAMGEKDDIFFLSADFGSPVLDKIRADFPNRFVNVGIAEQNLINISAGLALEGHTVFAYAIAPFITMRCYEQTRVSLALLSNVRPMNVNLIGVGAGYSYVVSGPTHQCYEDITLMRGMPNFDVLSPSDHIASESMFNFCYEKVGPKYLRLDAQVLEPIYSDEAPDISVGFSALSKGEKVCIMATGYMVHCAREVLARLTAKGMNIGLIDIYNLSSFDQAMLSDEISRYQHLITLEEGFKSRGGLDSLMFDFVNKMNLQVSIHNFGVSEYSFELGSRLELHDSVGIGPDAVEKKVIELMAEQ